MHGGSAAFEIQEELTQFQTLPKHLYMIPRENPQLLSFALHCPSCSREDPTSAHPLTTSLRQDVPTQPTGSSTIWPLFQWGPLNTAEKQMWNHYSLLFFKFKCFICLEKSRRCHKQHKVFKCLWEKWVIYRLVFVDCSVKCKGTTIYCHISCSI